MNNKQSFHRWINQKQNMSEQAKKINHQDHGDDEPVTDNYDEQAAAEESSSEDISLPVYTRTYKIDHTDQKKHLTNVFRFKPLAWAGLSAVVIGLSMGFFMLFIMGGFADDDHSQNTSTGQMASSNNEAGKREQTSQFELKPVTAFVLQGGVFNQPDNADSIQNAFKEAGYSTVMWEKDEQMYLFTGIASTKSAAEELIGDKQEIPEVYVKKWQTDKINVHTNQDTFKWLKSVRENLVTSIQSISDNKELNTKAWKSVKNAHPNEDKQYAQLYEEVEAIAESNSNNRKQQAMLLNIWKSLKNISAG